MMDSAPTAIRIKVTIPPVTMGAGDIQIASTNGARANQALGAAYRLSRPATIPMIETIAGSSKLVRPYLGVKLDELSNVPGPTCGA